MSTAIQRQSGWLLQPQSFDELMRFAELISKSTLAPKDYRGNPGNCIVAIQLGASLGLSPLQALQGIAVIGGKPAAYGDAFLAVIQSSDVFEGMEETFDDATGTASCTMRRKGRTPVTRTFSMDDAERAHLAKKQGPWQEYPRRMLQMRARGFAGRDLFADVLMGLQSAEEMEDIAQAELVPRAPAAAQRVESKPVETSLDERLRPQTNVAPVPSGHATAHPTDNKGRPTFRWKENEKYNNSYCDLAPVSALTEYIGYLNDRVLMRTDMAQYHDWAKTHRAQVENLLRNQLLLEQSKAREQERQEKSADIADKLQDIIDGPLHDPSDENDAWGVGRE